MNMSEEITNNNTTTTPTDGNGEQPARTKITFSPEQQARVDALIRNAQGRAASELRAEAAELRGKVEAISLELDQVKAERTQHAEQLETLKAQQSEQAELLKQREAELAQTRKSTVIQQAAQRLGFFDAEQTEKLVSDQLTFDASGKLVTATGIPVVDHLTGLAQRSPHLVRSEVKTGSGSTESRDFAGTSPFAKSELQKYFGRGSNAAETNRMALEQPERYRALRREALRLKLL